MKKEIKFVLVSGLGFLIDFIIYNMLIYFFKLNVDISNIISSFVGVTFVFLTSTKKIFATNTKRIALKDKYLVYVIYEFILILIVSYIMIYLKELLINICFMKKYTGILVKIGVTPFTLLINYVVMKYLTKW